MTEELRKHSVSGIPARRKKEKDLTIRKQNSTRVIQSRDWARGEASLELFGERRCWIGVVDTSAGQAKRKRRRSRKANARKSRRKEGREKDGKRNENKLDWDAREGGKTYMGA